MGICIALQCVKETRTPGSDLCGMHYFRLRRSGSLELTVRDPKPRADLKGRRFGTLTVIGYRAGGWLLECDCGVARTARSFELNNGLAVGCANIRAHRLTISYEAAHDRCRADRGSAADHRCIDCAASAQHWSYNHDDPQELTSSARRTRGLPYSNDPAHYSPRCARCHKHFDLAYLGLT